MGLIIAIYNNIQDYYHRKSILNSSPDKSEIIVVPKFAS